MDSLEIHTGQQTILYRKSTDNSYEMPSRKREEILSNSKISDSSDSGTNVISDEPFINTAECTSTHDGRQLFQTILPLNIDTLYQTLYAKSKFLDKFFDTRKIFDIVHTDWAENEDGLQTRLLKCKMPFKGNIGPKFSCVNIRF